VGVVCDPIGCQTHSVPPSLERDTRNPESTASDAESGSESASIGSDPPASASFTSAPSDLTAPDPVAEARRLAEHGVVRVRADNPSPLTLSGTNSWIVGRDPTYVVDPGPALEEHIERLVAAVDARGGLGGIVLTHDHADHSEGVAALRERRPAPLAAGRGEVDVELVEGARFGPFVALATPGHAPDHLALIYGHVCFTGDAVLGEGSVFIAPDPGALAGYLAGLRGLRGRELDVLCPGHGPPIWEPGAKLEEYIAHRLERERLLLTALAAGSRSTDELLDAAWPDVPAALRPVAAVSLRAHLDKLEDEGRLPAGVERPSW
jgi:glyoxylase-like metal-dependent hydrolase (beta-lactamase superfamily II)